MVDANDLVRLSTWILPLLIAITFHEAAHGFIAWRLGDDTARRLGRVTFNPVAHIDPFGTVLLPALLALSNAGFLFGYAKPVPVNFARLRSPKRDMVWVAAAGPGVNLLLALASAAMFHVVWLLPDFLAPWLALNLHNMILINLILAVFNMIPLPPLDGGRVAVGLLPHDWAIRLARLERYGIFILIGILILPALLGRAFGTEFSLFESIIWPPVEFLRELILTIAGFGRGQS
ncbi:MAG: site-2 protease family protein [Sphingomonadales bacterium]